MMRDWPGEFARVEDLDPAWREPGHGRRLRAVRHAAERLHDRFASGPRVLAVRSLPLTELPYPSRYAFGAAARSPAPFVTLTHRALLVRYLQAGSPRTLLFNPTDVVAARATPFFARLAASMPTALEPILAKRYAPLDEQLAALGFTPADIDYVAFDHFHTQDVRRLVGPEGRFPKATLLAPRVEWAEWDDLHPMQRDWYVAGGKDGVDLSSVALIDGDYLLGDGVLLARTPGHTIGNQTLFLNTAGGVWGTSENGTCADSWSPFESRVAGVASAVRRTGHEVVLNSNTPETAVDQYASMVLERTLVDRVARAPGFVQMFPSSEVTPSWSAPGLSPTLTHGTLSYGDLAPPRHSPAG